jgi:hypothetical protein
LFLASDSSSTDVVLVAVLVAAIGAFATVMAAYLSFRAATNGQIAASKAGREAKRIEYQISMLSELRDQFEVLMTATWDVLETRSEEVPGEGDNALYLKMSMLRSRCATISKEGIRVACIDAANVMMDSVSIHPDDSFENLQVKSVKSPSAALAAINVELRGLHDVRPDSVPR